MSPPINEERLEPIDELMEEFLDRVRRGESASAEEYGKQNPGLSDAIDRLFPVLSLLEDVAQRPTSTSRPQFPTR